MTRTESNKVTYLYFIMSVLVILIHSVNNDTKFQLFFSENGIGQFAVPTFFFISAFLFFKTIRGMYDVKNKLRKRIRTILIPYILWNLIYYGIHLLLKPGHGGGFAELYDAAFNYTYNPAFWFVCQLILLNIISPLLYYVLKKNIYIVLFIIAMSLLIFFDIDIPYINEDAIIYYFVGAIFSKLYNENKVYFVSKKYAIVTIAISALMFTANRFLHGIIGTNMQLFRLFILSVVYTRLSFVFTIFYIFDLLCRYDKEYDFMKHTFFMYAMHYMIVRAMINLMRYVTYKYLPTSTFLTIETITFLISPIVCIVISTILANFLNRRFHKAYAVLTGGRL